MIVTLADLVTLTLTNSLTVAALDLIIVVIEVAFFLFQARVTQRIEGHDKPKEIRMLKKGDYFGEKALLR